ncbi:hypothetical protein HG535_0A02490 [Zygotorulaspora mrakii]|uniref:Tim10-like domain-containing protein n=1 Tax=Zygotorulaspora mrakii TaxID=42260 RepID=A0A7H9AVS1_ZYGMR|nr:uncharacterized protein HG535_0A02490 [Zygotorulaspora mrakii]QLG70311.1 hypothetical protein HG535_0A02490 [Zygotorulaspora mrakii]
MSFPDPRFLHMRNTDCQVPMWVVLFQLLHEGPDISRKLIIERPIIVGQQHTHSAQRFKVSCQVNESIAILLICKNTLCTHRAPADGEKRPAVAKNDNEKKHHHQLSTSERKGRSASRAPPLEKTTMSLFVNPFASQEVSQEKLDVAEVQFDAMNSTFNNILFSCLEKCIPHDHYSESELNKGEMSCVDRCVAKIHYSNRLIGAYVQAKGFAPDTHLPHYKPFKTSTADTGMQK